MTITRHDVIIGLLAAAIVIVFAHDLERMVNALGHALRDPAA